MSGRDIVLFVFCVLLLIIATVLVGFSRWENYQFWCQALNINPSFFGFIGWRL